MNIEFNFAQTSRGSFSAVSTPIFASKYSLELAICSKRRLRKGTWGETVEALAEICRISLRAIFGRGNFRYRNSRACPSALPRRFPPASSFPLRDGRFGRRGGRRRAGARPTPPRGRGADRTALRGPRARNLQWTSANTVRHTFAPNSTLRKEVKFIHHFSKCFKQCYISICSEFCTDLN